MQDTPQTVQVCARTKKISVALATKKKDIAAAQATGTGGTVASDAICPCQNFLSRSNLSFRPAWRLRDLCARPMPSGSPPVREQTHGDSLCVRVRATTQRPRGIRRQAGEMLGLPDAPDRALSRG